MKRLAISTIALLFLSLSTVNDTTAQASQDCGNGLVQRLIVGERGFVIPTPPDLRVRSAPNGERIGSLPLSMHFTVVAGPRCSDGISWWQIVADNCTRGWIAEGTDEHFVEPLAGGGSGRAACEPAKAVLPDSGSAPVIDAIFQVGFLGLGGNPEWEMDSNIANWLESCDQLAFGRNARLWNPSGCDDTRPLLLLTDFQPSQSIELVLIRATPETSTEVYRWRFRAGEYGELIAYINFPLVVAGDEGYYFVVADKNGDWLNNYENAGDTGLVTGFILPCEVPRTKVAAESTPLTYGNIALGNLTTSQNSGYYAFRGRADDRVTIELIKYAGGDDSSADPFLELFSSDGDLLVENDDAARPRYHALDAEIRNFSLQSNGLNFIIVSANNLGQIGMTFTLTIDN